MATLMTGNNTGNGLTTVATPDRLPYRPKDGYLSGYTVNPDGTISAKLGDQSMVLNGIMLDTSQLKGMVGDTAQIGKLTMDSKGNLVAQVSYQAQNTQPYRIGSGQQSSTVMTTASVPLTGFQADMAGATRATSGNLPERNNVYLRPDGQGYLAEVEAEWQGGGAFTAAYARQLTNNAQLAAGDRLNSKGGMRTSTLGGMPTSVAAGSRMADEINLRNRKGTLLT